MTALRLGLAVALLASFASISSAQQPPPPPTTGQPQPPKIDWIEGPTTAKVGAVLAEVEVPKGFMFAGPEDTKRLMELWENPINGNELGMLASDSEADGWVVVFSFDDVGYVPDDDRDSLDADAIMADLKRGNEEGNRLRAEKGWERLDLVGWQTKPYYDPKTNNLTWATLGRAASSSESINHNIRLLGRRGVMEAELVVAPEEYAAAVPQVNELLTHFHFVEGNRYGDYVSGTDRVAEYGLAALVTGGVVAAATKSGLLAKMWKLIVAGLAALGVGIKKLFGRKSDD